MITLSYPPEENNNLELVAAYGTEVIYITKMTFGKNEYAKSHWII